MIGRVLGPYRIEEEISRGGMGVVYRATDTRLGRDVALKVLPEELLHDAERRDRLLQEARAASALEHPHIAVIHAVGLLEEGGYRPEPEVDELVAAAHRAVPEATDVDVTVVREDGPAADVILRVAERLGAGLIVVGRRGLGEAPRPLGSVSEALLARSSVPVLVVPAP